MLLAELSSWSDERDSLGTAELLEEPDASCLDTVTHDGCDNGPSIAPKAKHPATSVENVDAPPR